MKKIFLFVKKTLWERYSQKKPMIPLWKEEYEEHKKNLEKLLSLLQELKITYEEIFTPKEFSDKKEHLLISAGGDGTFLYAASSIEKGSLLGYNTNPSSSYGHYSLLRADLPTKEQLSILEEIFLGKKKPHLLTRIGLLINQKPQKEWALNDFLICEKNPAQSSHYIISYHGKEEEQTSSGIWIATPTGYTGGFLSAGGKKKKPSWASFKVREASPLKNYSLLEGEILPSTSFFLLSYMQEGVIYIDGPKRKIPLTPLEKIELTLAPPLKAFL